MQTEEHNLRCCPSIKPNDDLIHINIKLNVQFKIKLKHLELTFFFAGNLNK